MPDYRKYQIGPPGIDELADEMEMMSQLSGVTDESILRRMAEVSLVEKKLGKTKESNKELYQYSKTPSQMRMLSRATPGAIEGAAVGGATLGLPGAAVGGIAGGLAGALSSIFDDQMTPEADAQPFVSAERALDLLPFAGPVMNKLKGISKLSPTKRALANAAVTGGANAAAPMVDQAAGMESPSGADPLLRGATAGIFDAALGVPLAREAGKLDSRKKLLNYLQTLSTKAPRGVGGKFTQKSDATANAIRVRAGLLLDQDKIVNENTRQMTKAQQNLDRFRGETLPRYDYQKSEIDRKNEAAKAAYETLLNRNAEKNISAQEKFLLDIAKYSNVELTDRERAKMFPLGKPQPPMLTPDPEPPKPQGYPPAPVAPPDPAETAKMSALRRTLSKTGGDLMGDKKEILSKIVNSNPDEAYSFVLAPITKAENQKQLKENLKDFTERFKIFKALGSDSKGLGASQIASNLRNKFYQELIDLSPKDAYGFANPDSLKARLETIGPEVTNFIFDDKKAYDKLVALAKGSSRIGPLGRTKAAASFKLGKNGLVLDQDTEMGSALVRPDDLAFGSTAGGLIGTTLAAGAAGALPGAALGTAAAVGGAAGLRLGQHGIEAVLKKIPADGIERIAAGDLSYLSTILGTSVGDMIDNESSKKKKKGNQ